MQGAMQPEFSCQIRKEGELKSDAALGLTFLSIYCRADPGRTRVRGLPPWSTGLWRPLGSGVDDICHF